MKMARDGDVYQISRKTRKAMKLLHCIRDGESRPPAGSRLKNSPIHSIPTLHSRKRYAQPHHGILCQTIAPETVGKGSRNAGNSKYEFTGSLSCKKRQKLLVVVDYNLASCELCIQWMIPPAKKLRYQSCLLCVLFCRVLFSLRWCLGASLFKAHMYMMQLERMKI